MQINLTLSSHPGSYCILWLLGESVCIRILDSRRHLSGSS